jgi:hypothetical protein
VVTLQRYSDHRPAARLRLPVTDEGVVLRHGAGPGGCDERGARNPSLVADDGRFVLFYDAVAADGWRNCAATSTDLRHWERHGPVLVPGDEDADDATGAHSPWVIHDGERWHMFYIGCSAMWTGPDGPGGPIFQIPDMPYLTLKATATDLLGPWEKDYGCVPFRTEEGTFYETTASSGWVLRHGDEYLQFFSGSTWHGDVLLRTLGLARTRDLNGPWSIDPEPIVPPAEQVENSSLYVDAEANRYWLFTNHVGIDDDGFEFTDAVWAYWSDDPTRWNPDDKAVVVDGSTCGWSSECIGMPAVTELDGRLAVLYDAPGGARMTHMGRDIGLAWLELPLQVPT